MIGALWTGISGLAAQQKALDNESHNIANVNTIGYKASRISFADQMYQDRIGKGAKILDADLRVEAKSAKKSLGEDETEDSFTVLNSSYSKRRGSMLSPYLRNKFAHLLA